MKYSMNFGEKLDTKKKKYYH